MPYELSLSISQVFVTVVNAEWEPLEKEDRFILVQCWEVQSMILQLHCFCAVFEQNIMVE